MTDINIAGIEPATGERARILRELSDAAFEAIKIIELDISGIRDGDGFWHSDVLGHMTNDLASLCKRLEALDKPVMLKKDETQHALVPDFDDDEYFPF